MVKLKKGDIVRFKNNSIGTSIQNITIASDNVTFKVKLTNICVRSNTIIDVTLNTGDCKYPCGTKVTSNSYLRFKWNNLVLVLSNNTDNYSLW